MRTVSIFAFVLVITATDARAGWKDADACAARLSGDSRLIYDRVKRKMMLGDRPGNEVRITSTVNEMYRKTRLPCSA